MYSHKHTVNLIWQERPPYEPSGSTRMQRALAVANRQRTLSHTHRSLTWQAQLGSTSRLRRKQSTAKGIKRERKNIDQTAKKTHMKRSPNSASANMQYSHPTVSVHCHYSLNKPNIEPGSHTEWPWVDKDRKERTETWEIEIKWGKDR